MVRRSAQLTQLTQLALFSETKLSLSPGATAPPRLLRQLDRRLAEAQPPAPRARRLSRPPRDRERDAIARDLADAERLAALNEIDPGRVKGPIGELRGLVDELGAPAPPRQRPGPPSLVDEHTTRLRCEPGAWGLRDRCRHHEGQPFDARGLCRWGRLAELERRDGPP
jgi:hypothetical protein